MVAVSQVKGTPFAATCYPLIRNLGVPLFLCGAIARAFATVNSGTPTHVEWHDIKKMVSQELLFAVLAHIYIPSTLVFFHVCEHPRPDPAERCKIVDAAFQMYCFPFGLTTGADPWTLEMSPQLGQD